MNWDAAVAAGIAAVSPIVMLLFVNRGLRRKQEEDWKRQDAVAARLEASNKKTALAASSLGERVVGRLDTIHTLVNSNLTEAVLKAKSAKVLLLVEWRKDQNPNAEKRAWILAAEQEVAEMESQLADRARQAAIIAAKAKE